MVDPFDPYHKWLGIPPDERPANHYRLLGIALFESDPDVIEAAADRQMAHLRTYQGGKHAGLSQRLLNEIAAAKLVLLDQNRKRTYDETLQKLSALAGRGAGSGQARSMVAAEAGETRGGFDYPVVDATLNFTGAGPGYSRTRQPTKKTSTAWQKPAITFGVAATAGIVLLILSTHKSATPPATGPVSSASGEIHQLSASGNDQEGDQSHGPSSVAPATVPSVQPPKAGESDFRPEVPPAAAKAAPVAVTSVAMTPAKQGGESRSTTAPIGVNLDSNADWMTSRIWIDARKTFRPWGQLDQPWTVPPGMKLTADGYPLQDAGVMSMMLGYPDGIYKLSYEGTGDLTFAPTSMAQFAGKVMSQGNRHFADVRLKHDGGRVLHMKLTHINPRDPVHRLRLISPGYPSDTKEIYTREFVHRLAPFKCLRFMDWLGTNDSAVKHWNDRTRLSMFTATGPKGVPYEDILSLSNSLEKDPWLNIPDQATDEYVRELAKFLHMGTNQQRQLYIEYSNELWNSQFQQFHRLVAAAKANPQLTRTDDFGRAAEQAAARLVSISKIFHDEFQEEAGRVHLVFGGQAVNTYFLDSGLEFIQLAYGDPKKYIDGIAIGLYFGNPLPPEVDKPGLTLDGIFRELDQAMAGYVTSSVRNHAAVAAKYGLRLWAYEGGQHLTAGPSEVNESIKRQAQFDPRMGSLLKQMIDIWVREGGEQFMHFSHICPYSKFGYWGLLEDIQQPGSVKWDAILSTALPPGDANLNGSVDFADFETLRKNFGRDDGYWEQGDFNQDRRVDAADFKLMMTSLEKQLAADGKAAPATGESRAGEHERVTWSKKQLAELQKFAEANGLVDR